MRAWSSLISNVLSSASPFVHGHRVRAVGAAVEGLLRGGRLSVTGLGRHLTGSSERHGVKRMDRLVGNSHLQGELWVFYMLCIGVLVGAKKRPLILVDWSELTTNGQTHVLRAAVVVANRALPIYAEVHPQKSATSRAVQDAFLDHLKTLLPPDCRPILVTDAGFRGPWFAKIQSLEWDFIGRVRHNTHARARDEKPWFACKSLHKCATYDPQNLGAYELAKSAPTNCHLVLVKQKPKGRVHRTCFGQRAQWTNSRKAAQSAKEPWLLATSLHGDDPANVVKGYFTRMRIEESFRDTKDPRYGWGSRFSMSRSCERFAVLMMIDAIALLIAWLIGLLGERVNAERRYQVSSTRTRRVLSVGFLGRRMIRSEPPDLPADPLQWAVNSLQALVLIWD